MKVERTIHPSSFIPHPFLLLFHTLVATKVVRKVLVRRDLRQAADAIMSPRPLGELSRSLLIHGRGQSFCTPLYAQPFDVAASCSGFFSSAVLKRYLYTCPGPASSVYA